MQIMMKRSFGIVDLVAATIYILVGIVSFVLLKLDYVDRNDLVPVLGFATLSLGLYFVILRFRHHSRRER